MIRSVIAMMLTAFGIGLSGNSLRSHRDIPAVKVAQARRYSNQRQKRKDRRRAHAAGHKKAFV